MDYITLNVTCMPWIDYQIEVPRAILLNRIEEVREEGDDIPALMFEVRCEIEYFGYEPTTVLDVIVINYVAFGDEIPIAEPIADGLIRRIDPPPQQQQQV